MENYTISILPRDNSTGLYDLTVSTFEFRRGYVLSTYVAKDGDEMRIDNIAKAIYSNTNYVDILLGINNIIMPLNIREGDEIVYPSATDAEFFRVRPELFDDIKAQLINVNKKQRIDSNRQKRNEEESFGLPPSINEKQINPVTVSGDTITIGGGLF